MSDMTHYSHSSERLLTYISHEEETLLSLNGTNKIFQENVYGRGVGLKTLLIMKSVISGNEHESWESVPHDRCSASVDTALRKALAEPDDRSSPSADVTGGAAAAEESSISIRHEYLLTKYAERWKALVEKSKKDGLKQTRRDTVNKFLDRLRNKNCTRLKADAIKDKPRKSNMTVCDFRTYQHRYSVQKHIIALQKAKLEEQNKVIEELKLNKIVHDSSESLIRMKDEIRKTYFEMDRKLKPKLQSLSKELKITEFEEPTMVLNCLRVPQFLKRMEARARQREEKHAMIRERRRQLDEERARAKRQEELEKAEMDKEEKNRRIESLRQKRRREKIENIRKKQHAERTRALVVMAELHYERTLMTKYGIRPLRLLVQARRWAEEAARALCDRHAQRRVFLHWMWHVDDVCFERNFKADQLYRKKLLTRAFMRFKEVHRASVLKQQVAEDYSDLVVSRAVFCALRAAVAVSRAERAAQWHRAVTYYHSNLLFKTFTSWRALPALNALKREQEVRKLKWRQKVLLVVPDYTPPDE